MKTQKAVTLFLAHYGVDYSAAVEQDNNGVKYEGNAMCAADDVFFDGCRELCSLLGIPYDDTNNERGERRYAD